LHALAVFHGEPLQEKIRGGVVEHDAHDLVVDDALHQFSGPAQEGFHIEDGAGLAPNFVQEQKRIGLAAGAFEKARIFDGRG
jgi:hypothetical protein